MTDENNTSPINQAQFDCPSFGLKGRNIFDDNIKISLKDDTNKLQDFSNLCFDGDYKKTITEYFSKDNFSPSLLELVSKVVLFDFMQKEIIKNFSDFKEEKAKSILNDFSLTHKIIQENLLKDIFSCHKFALGFFNLFKDTKDYILKDEKFSKIENILSSFENPDFLKEKTLEECAFLVYLIFDYFNSFLDKKFSLKGLNEISFKDGHELSEYLTYDTLSKLQNRNHKEDYIKYILELEEKARREFEK